MGISGSTWFITNRCNLHCEYCFTYFDDKFPREDSTIDVGRDMVDLLLINSDTNINIAFFGGEPLLKFDLMQEVAEYADFQASRGLRKVSYSVTTNGTLINDDVIKWFKSRRISPLISIDGMPHADNKRLFHDGTHSAQIALDNGVKLLKAGINPTVRWTVHPDQLSRLYDDVLSIYNLGFNMIALEFVYEVEWTDKDKILYGSELRKIAKLYLDLLRRGKNIMIKPIDDAFRLYVVDERQMTRCGTATGGIGVAINGDIYPCHRYVCSGNNIIGNVKTGWNIPDLRKCQDWHPNKITVSDGRSCRDCPVNLRCPGGGCLAVNIDMFGDSYKTPSIYCDLQLINQRVTNDIAYILHGEKNKIFKRKLGRPDINT